MSTNVTRIIGVDPGIASVGVAILENPRAKLIAAQHFEANAKTLDCRVAKYAKYFDELLEEYKPDIVAIETQYFAPYGKKTGAVAVSIIKVGLVRGAFIGVASIRNIPTMGIYPTEAKLALTGDGSANKNKMIECAQSIFKVELRITEDHVADALGIALAGLKQTLVLPITLEDKKK